MGENIQPAIPGGSVVRHMPGYALRGALSGLLCCSPGLLMALWRPADGIFLWALLFSWWAPGVSYGVLVTVPLATALKRPSAAVAFLSSAGGYFVALWLPNSGVFGMPEAHPWLRDYSPGAVGAAILAAGTLPWRGAAAVRAALLTVIAGAIATLAFEVDLFPRSTEPSAFMKMLPCIVGFVVWQSATAACLSLGLESKRRRQPDAVVHDPAHYLAA